MIHKDKIKEERCKTGRDELLEAKEANRLKVDEHIEELNWDNG